VGCAGVCVVRDQPRRARRPALPFCAVSHLGCACVAGVRAGAAGTVGLAVAALAVVAIATVGLHRAVLESAGNKALSDAEASDDLNQYFATAGLHAKAAVRKSGVEARDELNSFVQSLDSEDALGRRFCERHPDRCGKAAAARAHALALADANTARRNRAEAKAKEQGLLHSENAPAESAAPAVASHARDKRLGDDVMDVPPTAAADDGDVHVDGASVQQYMFAKDSKAAQQWLKSDESALRGDAPAPTHSLKLRPASKLAGRVASRLGKLSQADDATLAKCNVPPPRPAYCRLLLDMGVDVDSVKTAMPDRNETEYRYASNNGGLTRPLHALVPINMQHGDGSDEGMNYVNFGVPDHLVSAAEQHEEGNLVPSEYGREKGGPISPLLREGATRTQNPHWAEEGSHYPDYHYKIKSLDRATSDQVLYGALDDYKTLGLALADDCEAPRPFLLPACVRASMCLVVARACDAWGKGSDRDRGSRLCVAVYAAAREVTMLCGGHATTADVSPTNELSLSLCLLCALSLSCVCVRARSLSLSLSLSLARSLSLSQMSRRLRTRRSARKRWVPNRQCSRSASIRWPSTRQSSSGARRRSRTGSGPWTTWMPSSSPRATRPTPTAAARRPSSASFTARTPSTWGTQWTRTPTTAGPWVTSGSRGPATALPCLRSPATHLVLIARPPALS